MATVRAARNLKVGELILGRANLEFGLTKWFDCRVISRPVVSERGVCVEVQWQTDPFVDVASQIRNNLLYTECSNIRILSSRDVFSNELFRYWSDMLCSTPPIQVTPSMDAQNALSQTQSLTPVARVLEGGRSHLIPAVSGSRPNTGFNQSTGTVVTGNSYIPIRGPRMEFHGPFQLPGRPSAVSWNPVPRIPQSSRLSPSLRGARGVTAEIRVDQNLLPFPAPIGVQTLISAPRAPANNGRQESRTERPDLVAPIEGLDTVVINDNSCNDGWEEEEEKTESKEEEGAQADQSRKRAREEDASEGPPEDDTPTFRDLNKFGLFLLAMQWDKPGFNAEEWIVKQKGTLAVMKVDEDA